MSRGSALPPCGQGSGLRLRDKEAQSWLEAVTQIYLQGCLQKDAEVRGSSHGVKSSLLGRGRVCVCAAALIPLAMGLLGSLVEGGHSVAG